MANGAAGHPLRSEILGILEQGERSPSEIAAELGEPISNVSYHVRQLLQQDAVEATGTRPVRGALEHFYRSKVVLCEHCHGAGVVARSNKSAKAGNGASAGAARI
jgi:DNA-binding transcriptional ArsR family regulator